MSADEGMTDDEVQPFLRTVAWLKAQAVKAGYSFVVDPDGTERMVRPNGETAVIARKEKTK